ncbi:hypothetical protein TSAR_007878 [Trichomalopsis sarcophagae]|uniref:BPTI/Kunitz inhibitor domain-containing protein n=1 Tax=Trichomalopsis sarcophagae TaxID=543379 RepID=A0A232EYE6_9HYME|nr:hypothetical protein TSAR_007878 [Trichomalopsis sarcophagae]
MKAFTVLLAFAVIFVILFEEATATVPFQLAVNDKSRCNTPFGQLGRRKRGMISNGGSTSTVFYKFIENTNSCVPFYAQELPPFYGFRTKEDCDLHCRGIYHSQKKKMRKRL